MTIHAVRTRLAAVVVAAALLATGACTKHQEAGPADVDRPALTVAQAPNSVAYLREQFGVDEAEALRRLAAQEAMPAIADDLAERYPSSFGGMWLDQEGGGTVVVNAVEPNRLAPALDGLPSEVRTRTVAARWSLAELQATRTRLDTEINGDRQGSARPAEVTVDEQSNTVSVYQRRGADRAGARTADAMVAATREVKSVEPAVAAAVAGEPMVAVRQLFVGQTKEAAGAAPLCEPLACSKPIRGGMRLDVKRSEPAGGIAMNALWGQCTVGFTMGDKRNWDYILTAGHCATGPKLRGITHTFSSVPGRLPISKEVFNFENGPVVEGGSTYPFDYSIQPYENRATRDYWVDRAPRNLVLAYCRNPAFDCASKVMAVDHVVAYNSAKVGSVVCATGSATYDTFSGYSTNKGWLPGTRCGLIREKDGGFQTDICARPGDSGGPLFGELSRGAYGILSGGSSASGPCRSKGPERNAYSPLSGIVAHVTIQTAIKERTNYGFFVRTSP